MCKQILPTSTIRNIWRTVRRTCMLLLGLKGLKGESKRGVTFCIPSMTSVCQLVKGSTVEIPGHTCMVNVPF